MYAGNSRDEFWVPLQNFQKESFIQEKEQGQNKELKGKVSTSQKGKTNSVSFCLRQNRALGLLNDL
jgi:hypothetical protein